MQYLIFTNCRVTLLLFVAGEPSLELQPDGDAESSRGRKLRTLVTSIARQPQSLVSVVCETCRVATTEGVAFCLRRDVSESDAPQDVLLPVPVILTHLPVVVASR